MSTETNLKAAQLAPSSLPRLPSNRLCNDFIGGFCRFGEDCKWSHEICAVSNSQHTSPVLQHPENFLSLKPRGSFGKGQAFDSEGPGKLSSNGPRHDNDHVEIKHIKILPTTNEILNRRPIYMPTKDPFSHHHYPCGQQRLLDTHFRHLRYDSTESIIDACYHASQKLADSAFNNSLTDYDDRMVTPKGFRYSLFRGIQFEELIFAEKKSTTVRVSFACPKSLRGSRLGPSNHLEDGMLVALVGLCQKDNAISTTFMEIYMRQTTNAMRPRTGNDLRASAILSFADPTDIEAVRRLLYNSQGLLQEIFVLVEIPSVLYAGFFWTLRQLQTQSKADRGLAFSHTIAPLTPGTSPTVAPPQYATGDQFMFQLNSLRKKDFANEAQPLTLKPKEYLASTTFQRNFIDRLCLETTLDRGQAHALCENLCRGFAFTQGPPGTGKTYLGVSLARALLNSRPSDSRKPILVVCMTNHALDSFLEGIRDAGISKLMRLGRGSKESWTQAFQISILSRNLKKTAFERSSLTQSYSRVKCLMAEGTNWCQSLNEHSLCWPAVRELLKAKHPAIFDRFACLEKIGETRLSELRFARRAGGFAYDFWCMGGDIKDVDRLLEKFNTALGSDYNFEEEGKMDFETRQSVMDQIVSNINLNTKSQPDAADVWNLNLSQRNSLLQEWREELDLKTLIDKTAEIHRRHQVALGSRIAARGDIDSRCMSQQDIIAMTTTACAMYWETLNKVKLQTVICEEAGEVMEAQFLCTLFPSVEHSISIGDPLQLRPQLNEPTLSLETEAGSVFRLDESLIERMMLPVTHGVAPIASSCLNIQRRMHPEIANLMRATLYPYLEDHETTFDREPVPVMVDRVWWLDHQMPEDTKDSRSSAETSSSNTYEVEMTAGLIEHLVQSNEYEFRDITILTPYNQQLAALTDRFEGMCSLWLSEKDRKALLDEGLLDPATVLSSGTQTDVSISSMLKLATIDNFQGEESRVIVLSTVRSNSDGQVGFLRTPNRINVGCSRARDGFYIIGNANLMRKVDMWQQIVDDLAAKGKIGPAFRTCCPRHPDRIHSVHSPEEWRAIPQCQVPCEAVLACGHGCTMTCHAPALHDRIGCPEPCPRTHQTCGHTCTKTCGEPCGDCDFPLQTVVLACGHEAIKKCAAAQEDQDIVCNAFIERVQLDCGHLAERRCSTMNNFLFCEEPCEQLLPCGHRCRGKCGNCVLNGWHPKCNAICSQPLQCGHFCNEACHGMSPCPPCIQPCLRSCGHGGCSQPCSKICDPCVRSCDCSCPHKGSCSTMCCLPCDIIPCGEPCTKTLSCGHTCPSVCGEICPKPGYCPQCITGDSRIGTQMFLPCGHTFDIETLDNHVSISILYQLSSTGQILRPNTISSQALLRDVDAYCPDCGEDCRQVRRYALQFKMSDFEGNLDRLYATFSRKLHMFMEQMFWAKERLDRSFVEFSRTLKPSPLVGRANEELIQNRSGTMNELLKSVADFRDDVVQKSDNDIDRLEAFLGISVSPDEIGITSPFKLRFDTLLCRGRLILMEESSRILTTLRGLKNPSQHTLLLIGGMKQLLIRDAENHLVDMKKIIAESEENELKSLEAEARLIQISSYVVLRRQGVENELDVSSSFQKILELCRTYPDTAGRFFNTYTSVRGVVNGDQQISNLYTKGAQAIWWGRPKHVIDYLTFCRFGHPFSSEGGKGCLECGREIPKAAEPKDPNSYLKVQDFLEAMKTFNFPSVHLTKK